MVDKMDVAQSGDLSKWVRGCFEIGPKTDEFSKKIKRGGGFFLQIKISRQLTLFSSG